jgi:hypothetical protein
MSAPTAIQPGIRIKGVYQHLDLLLTAIDRLKAADIRGWDVCSPLPRHEIEEIIYDGKPSPVRWWTLTGGMLGLSGGFLLPALTAAQWPMINPGGKPVVALAPYAVIMFESTIMLAGLFTLAGMIVHCGLPSFWLDPALQDPRWSDESFGIVFTNAPEDQAARIQDILRGAGAVEVTSGDDTIYEEPNAL